MGHKTILEHGKSQKIENCGRIAAIAIAPEALPVGHQGKTLGSMSNTEDPKRRSERATEKKSAKIAGHYPIAEMAGFRAMT